MIRQSILSNVGVDHSGIDHRIDLLVFSQVGLSLKEVQELFLSSDFYLVRDSNPNMPGSPSFEEHGFSVNKQKIAVATWLDLANKLT